MYRTNAQQQSTCSSSVLTCGLDALPNANDQKCTLSFTISALLKGKGCKTGVTHSASSFQCQCPNCRNMNNLKLLQLTPRACYYTCYQWFLKSVEIGKHCSPIEYKPTVAWLDCTKFILIIFIVTIGTRPVLESAEIIGQQLQRAQIKHKPAVKV